MGTHPIFESDFDCLTEMAETSLTEWAQRWVDGRTGWHKTAPNTTLQSTFPSIFAACLSRSVAKQLTLYGLLSKESMWLAPSFPNSQLKTFSPKTRSISM